MVPSFLIWFICLILFYYLAFNGFTALSPNGIGNIFFVSLIIGLFSFISFIFFVVKKSPFLALLLLIGIPGICLIILLWGSNSLTIQQEPISLVSQNTIQVQSNTPTLALVSTYKPRVLDGGRLFNLVNDYRIKNGLSKLDWYHPLCEYAKKRSQDVKNDWSHEGYLNDAKNGSLYSIDCPECERTGENLAKDFYNEESILQGWIKSASHKRNLDDSWTWGCAMFYSNNYVSFIFGQKKP